MNQFKKLKRVVVKEELVALTGDMESAIILNQFIYWSERIKDFDKFISEENERRKKNDQGSSDIEFQNGWIYKDLDELKDEIMFTCSTKTISRKIAALIEKGWLDRRNNPNFKWDRTYQYRVNLNNIIIDLHKIGYVLQDYKIDLEVLKNSNGQNDDCNGHIDDCNGQNDFSNGQNVDSKGHIDGAIPEITTETTTEISSSINQSPCNSKEKERQNEITTTNEFQNILNNSGYYEFEEKYSSAIEQSLRLLYFSNKPLLIDNMSVPTLQVRKDLERLRWKHLDLALRDFKNQAEIQEIRYPAGYLSRCIYNAIFQSDLKLEAELKYNGLA